MLCSYAVEHPALRHGTSPASQTPALGGPKTPQQSPNHSPAPHKSSPAVRAGDPQRTLDNFDFNFNKKMNRSLVFDQATAAFIARHEDALFLGPPGTGKSHLAQAIGHVVNRAGLPRDLP